jgi:predicted nucleic acid-binding Zn ribbon protein
MRKPIAVSELLAQGKAKLERLKSGADAAERTLCAVQQCLPGESAAHVWGASLDADGVLTVVTDTGGWATRIRYAVPELMPAVAGKLSAAVVRVVVRVRPRPG